MINLLDEVKKDIGGVIHVGANTGQEIPYYSQLKKPILYFEPLEDIFKILKENISGKENFIAEKFAIGPEDCKIDIFESTKQGVSSSILFPEKHLEIFPERKFKRIICQQIKLDTYFQTHNMIYNTLVMDIQGYEYPALQGSIETLKNIKYILLEVWYESLYKDTVLKDEIDDFLLEHRFVEKQTICQDKYFGNTLYMKI